MTTRRSVQSSPSVLNTTVLSNFAYVEQLWVVAELSGVCAVPVVREELSRGVESHPYLESALQALDETIPVVSVSDAAAEGALTAREHLDPGEAQAFAVADERDGRLLTDDGDARSFARERGVTVVGSVGVLLAAIEADRISEDTADRWLSIWVDEIGYYVPHRDIAAYR